ncbi:transcription factor [Fusarium longipes]|uniref:Transcription factor n=1 Tax=Fusarium longipes TaxID=694270 RepID=A0A395SHV0_9HYPO|nr:transcription factor [Fusarium longipes]
MNTNRTRSLAESSTSSNQRSKRAKYTPVACDTCKKRKLKCIREDDQQVCTRCAQKNVECVFACPPRVSLNDDEHSPGPSNRELQSNVASLNQQVTALQEQVGILTAALQDITRRPTISSTTPQGNASAYRQDIRNVATEPREPQFIGPMRSAFSFQIAENSLSGMGIERAARESATPSELGESEGESVAHVDVLPSLGAAEIQRLLEFYDEEVVSINPFIDMVRLSRMVVSILRTPEQHSLKEVQAIKLAVATSVAIEAQGQNNISKSLIDDVEPVICRPSGEAFIDLEELQLMIMLSIYWFHCGEELLAWRTIGNAGRETIEIGLHRRSSLLENFKDTQERDLAIRCFWCVYILDRRLSYGTSLSFGISDRDIDPQLPEPVWEDLPLDSSPLSVPKDKVDLFDFLTQKWMHSIPPNLQLVFPRLSQRQNQPRTLQRLRTILYLRGNHIRSLVLRHHVLSAANIRADMQGAQLVVSLAQDTIQVLVNLNETSDIYTRQKPTFNYFLTAALASILLAVCNAPDVFADRCRQNFGDAVDLLKSFSQQGQVSRRLWKSIRGTINRALSLSGAPNGNSTATRILNVQTQDIGYERNSLDLDDSVDRFGLETDLLNLFSAFEEVNGPNLGLDIELGI